MTLRQKNPKKTPLNKEVPVKEHSYHLKSGIHGSKFGRFSRDGTNFDLCMGTLIVQKMIE